MITLKRVYDGTSRPPRGKRFLVERLWPRGISKASLHIDGWLKDVAPSDGLRRWFAHDPSKWDEFQKRYFEELDHNPDAWQPILADARRGPVELVYSARDTGHNNAVALKRYLDARRVREVRG